MKNYQVTAVYFSATGNAKRSVLSIGRCFSEKLVEIDVTMDCGKGNSQNFGREDLVIFGAPVYGGRVYRGAMESFLRMKGDDTPCIITVSYGNRHYDDALLEMFDMVKEQGFLPIGAAALVGEHTYGSIQIGRPAEADQKENEAFAARLIKCLEEGAAELKSVPGNRPYINGEKGGQGGRFFPTALETCVKCGLCARHCPTRAIALDRLEETDAARCISCFRCVKNCPVHARGVFTEEYQVFSADFSEKLKQRRENEYFMQEERKDV